MTELGRESKRGGIRRAKWGAVSPRFEEGREPVVGPNSSPSSPGLGWEGVGGRRGQWPLGTCSMFVPISA